MAAPLPVVALLIALMQGVLCETWKATLPKRMEGVAGSCLEVPCRFDVPQKEEANIVNSSCAGIWKKGRVDAPPVFSEGHPHANTMQGEIVGDLAKKNCSTTFHRFPKNQSDIFFFRLSCLNHVKYNFHEGVMIDVRAEPPPPQLTSVGQVTEGDQVRLQCFAPVPCSTLPPSITWLPRDPSWQEQTQTQQSLDGLRTMTSTLTFAASAEHHDHSVSCSVSYPLTGGGSSRPPPATHTLNVLYGPRGTEATLSTSVPVPEGSNVTFTCRSDANPPVSLYTWYRVDGGELTGTGEGRTLVLKVTQKDSGAHVCEARAQNLSQWSAPVTLEVSTTSGSRLEAAPYALCGVLLVVCVVTVVVGVYKYQSISGRLKRIELQVERTYTDLRPRSVTSEYEQLQSHGPTATPSDEVHNYENPIALRAMYKNLPPKST
ncbi:myelin-associated glycoprotein [Pungitius pungitius]|uniref:myelin-associated glycoprotein n=1 Tax=Pungitius pungitius TaxID=134920 RepID=UPI002E15FFA7